MQVVLESRAVINRLLIKLQLTTGYIFHNRVIGLIFSCENEWQILLFLVLTH